MILMLVAMSSLMSRDLVEASIADYDDEDEILVLNATNFDKAIDEFKTLFVIFC